VSARHTSLRLSLEKPDGTRTLLGAMSWPDTLAPEAISFIRDNLFVAHAGSPREARAVLEAGRVTPAGRARFLADKRVYVPEPPEKLAGSVELEEFIADFGVALRALRAAAPDESLVFEWL
jgi:hypothetical protein